MTSTGRCSCDAVRFTFSEPPLWQGHCHCDSCRRACGAGIVSWFGIRNGAWAITGDMLRDYASSPGVTRQFCGQCGTPVSYASDKFPDEIHFLAANLDNPEAFAPTAYYHPGERLSWVSVDPTLKNVGAA